MSCQPRPQPQASGAAASRARIGKPTNTPTRIRPVRPVCSGSISGLTCVEAAGGCAGAGGTSVPTPAAVESAEVGMGVLALPRRVAAGQAFRPRRVWGQRRYAYVTVGYATVGYASTL